jgi:tetratricopeptide (TPR) repeat protein
MALPPQASAPQRTTDSEALTSPLPLPDLSTAQTLPLRAEPGTVPQTTRPKDAAPTFAPEQIIANRYRIVRFLAQGGMGEVYEADDLDLRERVALKTLRADAGESDQARERFKREIHLARKVSHPNVCRIFDLGHHRVAGDAGAAAEKSPRDISFLTMEFLAGETLDQRLKRAGKMSPAEALPLVQQMTEALSAAHKVGIIHRDFKSSNVILVPTNDPANPCRVVVTDFGLARSQRANDSLGSSVTNTGQILGTPAYMAPEQVEATEITPAADIYALGVVLFEMVTGVLPFKADSTLGTILKRLNEPPPPPRTFVPELDEQWEKVILCCLARYPAGRFAQATDVAKALQHEAPIVPAVVAPAPVVPAVKARRWLRPVGIGVALLVLVLLGWALLRRGGESRATQPEVIRLLVADFNNQTAEPLFNGMLEPLFTVAMEGASFITCYDRGQARTLAGQIQKDAKGLDETLARLVAGREGINVVLSGSIARQDARYHITVKAMDVASGKPLLLQEAQADSTEYILDAVGRLTARVRRGLGDVTPESQLAAETFTAASLEAAQHYALAQEHQWAGKRDDAIKEYKHAIQLDTRLGRAYSGLATSYHALGQNEESKKYYEEALKLLDSMSERERFRTRGGYYLLIRNNPKAAEEFTSMLKSYPADSAGIYNLGLAHFYSRNMPLAVEAGHRAMQVYPKNLFYQSNVALFSMYASAFATATREARAVLDQNPTYTLSYIALALSELAQGNVAEATATYRRLEAVNASGASRAALGLADVALYEGRLGDAVMLLENGIKGDQANHNAAALVGKQIALAELHLLRGQKPQALALAEQALAATKDEGRKYVLARLYLNAGQESKALEIAQALSTRIEPDPRHYAKLIEGEAQLLRGKLSDAVTTLQDAQKLTDSWVGRLLLGRAYLEAKSYAEAHSEFDACLKRRGEATALLLDDVPSYRYLPPVYYYLGQVQAGLNSPAAVDSWQTFLQIKANGEEEPMITETRRRLAER